VSTPDSVVSYVNGIMDGEVMEAEGRGEFEAERVAIK